MICSRCKETLEITDAILGGYVCPYCGKFNPRKIERIYCLEKGCKQVKDVGKILKQHQKNKSRDMSLKHKKI